LKRQLAYRHMIAVADTFDGWAQDRRLTPEQTAQSLGRSENMRRLAGEVGPSWDPTPPATVSLFGFLGRLVLDEPAPPPTPRLDRPDIRLRPDSVLASPLQMFLEWKLSIACASCQETRSVPVRLLCGTVAEAEPVASVIRRRRCRSCGMAPSWVEIRDDELPSATRKVRLV
jgi:hypothetical protein